MTQETQLALTDWLKGNLTDRLRTRNSPLIAGILNLQLSQKCNNAFVLNLREQIYRTHMIRNLNQVNLAKELYKSATYTKVPNKTSRVLFLPREARTCVARY